MRVDFSKNIDDIALESSSQFENDQALLQRQIKMQGFLLGCPKRTHCVVCTSKLNACETFQHRAVAYKICSHCGHIQSEVQPPERYPTQIPGIGFDLVYQKTSANEFSSRVQRVYQPKLDWMLSCSNELKTSKDLILKKRWVELGSGSGGFLKALENRGATTFLGLESSDALLTTANEMLGKNSSIKYDGLLSHALDLFDADIYVSFFVLEHIEDTHSFFKALAKKPKGTIFYFSVPTHGFTTLLESITLGHASRHLDSGFHVQLFSDQSIKYGLDIAGFRTVAQWVFGQDVTDLIRYLITSASSVYPKNFLNAFQQRLDGANNLMQNAIDKVFLSDSRHVLAIKE